MIQVVITVDEKGGFQVQAPEGISAIQLALLLADAQKIVLMQVLNAVQREQKRILPVSSIPVLQKDGRPA